MSKDIIEDDSDFKIILNVLRQQVDFYSKNNNNDWSFDKNEGFKLGIKYCKDIISSMISATNQE